MTGRRLNCPICYSQLIHTNIKVYKNRYFEFNCPSCNINFWYLWHISEMLAEWVRTSFYPPKDGFYQWDIKEMKRKNFLVTLFARPLLCHLLLVSSLTVSLMILNLCLSINQQLPLLLFPIFVFQYIHVYSSALLLRYPNKHIALLVNRRFYKFHPFFKINLEFTFE